MKKILVSQPWTVDSIPSFDNYVKELEAMDCEVVIYPNLSQMKEKDILEWLPGFYGHICGSEQWTTVAMEKLPDIKIISRIGVGYETVNVSSATVHKIAVTTTPGAGAETVSEYAFSVMAALSRKLFQNDKVVRSGKWYTVTGRSFYRKTLGIVGFGLIGKQLARWAQGFGMNVMAYDPITDEKYAKENNITYVPLDELLAKCDYLSLHLPLLPTTKNLIGRRELALMKPTAQIVNAARGGIINEMALYEALRDGIIEGAGLDVFEHEPINQDNPLLTLDNVIFTPHMAGSTYEGLDAIVGAAFRNVRELIAGKVPHGIRNPEIFDQSPLLR